MAEERLQKILAHAGYGSRRACEEMIVTGSVTVDGKAVTELGTKADPQRQVIAVDGRAIRHEKAVYYLVNKPRWVISTCKDDRGRPTVLDLVPDAGRRLYPVGRLDADSEGLLILTNDGGLTELLTHPRYGVRKTYRVELKSPASDAELSRLRKGVYLAEGRVRPQKLRVIHWKAGAWVLEIDLVQGINREVRRILAGVGLKAKRLVRTRIGSLGLGGLAPGAWRRLSPDEVDSLRKAALKEMDKR